MTTASARASVGAGLGCTRSSGPFGTMPPAARIAHVAPQPQPWPWRGAAGLGRRLLAGLLGLALLLVGGGPAAAMLQASPGETGTGLVRSLESLRDLDYQSWQVVASRSGPPGPQAPARL